jgi:hypothetical protein
MVVLTVPYHHAMRLGQGFSSYTQTFCLDGAVTIEDYPAAIPPLSVDGRVSLLHRSDYKIPSASPEAVSHHSVTFWSRFCDKLSEIIGFLNLSAARPVLAGDISNIGPNGDINGEKVRTCFNLTFTTLIHCLNFPRSGTD